MNWWVFGNIGSVQHTVRTYMYLCILTTEFIKYKTDFYSNFSCAIFMCVVEYMWDSNMRSPLSCCQMHIQPVKASKLLCYICGNLSCRDKLYYDVFSLFSYAALLQGWGKWRSFDVRLCTIIILTKICFSALCCMFDNAPPVCCQHACFESSCCPLFTKLCRSL